MGLDRRRHVSKGDSAQSLLRVSQSLCHQHSAGGLVAQSCATLATLRTATPRAPLTVGFSRQQYWRGLPFPSKVDLPNEEIEPQSPALQADSLLTGPQRSREQPDDIYITVALPRGRQGGLSRQSNGSRQRFVERSWLSSSDVLEKWRSNRSRSGTVGTWLDLAGRPVRMADSQMEPEGGPRRTGCKG